VKTHFKSAVSGKRQQRAKAARILLALHAEGVLQNPTTWTWDSIDSLPYWCLIGARERQQLQLICGAIYLSPDVRFWINQSALSALQELLGFAILDVIVKQADSMQLPREFAASIVVDFGVDPEFAETAAIRELLMAAGALVLNATVHQSLHKKLLVESSVVCSAVFKGEITQASAVKLLDAARTLQTNTALNQVA